MENRGEWFEKEEKLTSFVYAEEAVTATSVCHEAKRKNKLERCGPHTST